MPLNQSKLASFIEALANTIVGFVFSFGIQKLLNLAYDVEMSNTVAVHFVFWFTVASIARSYFIRRVWNSEFWKGLQVWQLMSELRGRKGNGK